MVRQAHYDNKHRHPEPRRGISAQYTLSLPRREAKPFYRGLSKGLVIIIFGLWIFVAPIAAMAFTPNDPLLLEQWYLSRVGAFEAWNATRADPSVVVAVIDSGVDIDHPDLAANIWTNPREVVGDDMDNDGNGFVDDVHGWDFLTNTSDPRPKSDDPSNVSFAYHHGTAVSGIIAALQDNGRGISGIAPRVKIMPLRALDSTGKGKSSTVIKAIDYAVANGAAIINLSFVSTLQQSPGSIGADTQFFRSIERARKAGVLVVAAAGNEATADNSEVVDLDIKPQVPVCEDSSNPFQSVIGVAATDRDDHRAVFSSFGGRCIDLSAPGDHFFVLTAARGVAPGITQESYSGYYKGTSLAAPIVSGAAALLKSLNPKLTADDLQMVLEQTADPIERGSIYDGRMGKGRVNIAKAVERVGAQFANIPLAQSVAVLASPPVAATVSQTSPVSVPIVTKKKTVESVLLALNEKSGVRLVRVADQSDVFDEIVHLPGSITSMAELTSGSIAVVHTAPKQPTEIIIFTSDGVPVRSWRPFGLRYTGAVTLAAGDVDGDGAEEIVVGAGTGVAPDVGVFSVDGKRKAQFLAYAKTFRGGVDVTVGNVLGQEPSEIITAPLTQAPAHIRVFDGNGSPKVQFFATPASHRLGASVVLLDRSSDGGKDIGVSQLQSKHGQLTLFGLDGKKHADVVAFDAVDRPFAVHRDEGSVFITVAARAQPSIVVVLSSTGKRLRVIQLPKNIESVALGTVHYTVVVQ